MDLEKREVFFTPLGDVDGTAGYVDISTVSNSSRVSNEAEQCLKDSLLLNTLTERVYELLLEDIRNQRERVIGAVPIGWKAPSLQADDNAAAIEELTLAYEGF